MTAIDKYIRLEAIGQWRPAPDEPTQEVVVSFGNATLQLTSLEDTPLTHWALRAVKRIGSTGNAIIYSTDSQGDETLLIDDAEMIRAITAVTREVGQQEPKKKSRKKFVWLGFLIVILGLLSQSPPLIYAWATKLTSPLRLQNFSKEMQIRLFPDNDFACTDSRASRALADFLQAMFDAYPPHVFVVNQSSIQSYGLANTLIYLPLDTVLAAKNPETLAAEIALNYAMSDRRALLYQTLETAGPLAAIQHIFGKNVTPELPITNASPNGEDFVAARDRLQNLRIDTTPLQELAAQHGFGLPLNTATPEAFEPDSFAALQQYCRI